MFRSESMREMFESAGARIKRLFLAEQKHLGEFPKKGNDWIRVVGFSVLATALADVALSKEAHAEDNHGVKDQVGELALLASVQPFKVPIEEPLIQKVASVPSKEDRIEGSIDSLMPETIAPLSLPDLGYMASNILPGVDVGAGLAVEMDDIKNKSTLQLLATWRFD